MKNGVFLFAILFSSSLLLAQNDRYTELSTQFSRLKEANNYDSALPIAKEMNAWALKNESDTSLRYAVSFRDIGNCFKFVQQIDSAIYNFNFSLKLLSQQKRNMHPDYANNLNKLGIVYWEMGDYKAAEDYFKQALGIRKKVLGEDHPDYARSLNNLGILYSDMGDYKAAEGYYKQALEIYKKVLGEDHPDYAMSLNNLGNVHWNMGDYKAAEGYYKQALEIRMKALGEEHADYALSLNSLGIVHYEMGNYKAAEGYYKQALEIYWKSLGEEHPDYAMSLINLGVLYRNIGDYKAAEDYFKQALEIKMKALGDEHPSYAINLNNLGILYETTGHYKSAEDYYIQALEIYKKTFGEEHPSYAGSLNNLGILYETTGHYKSAEDYYTQALEIYKKALSEEHPDYARSIANLGVLYGYMGDYKSAEDYYKQALEIRKKALGEVHPDYLSNENSLAYLYMKTYREKEALGILNKNFRKMATAITDNFEWLSDHQKEAYWKNEVEFYDKLSWFANQAYNKVPEAVGLNYNAVLSSKGKLLETKIANDQFIGAIPEVDTLREELAYRRRLLAKMESDGSTDKEKLDKLHHEADSLDKRLTMSWPEYAQQKKNLSITWNQVQEQLAPGEAAIEFVRFKNEDDSLFYYNALVLRKEDTQPQLIKLCKEKDLEGIAPKMGFSAYYPLVWQPMENALKSITTIYYAPTGLFTNVPFPALYAPSGSGDVIAQAKTDKRGVVIENEHAKAEANATFLMDRYTLHQLTSTRYLAMGLKQKSKEPIAKDMAMMGGVNYDYLPGTTAAVKSSKKKKNAQRSSESANGKLGYLEGTKTEVEQINQQLSTSTWRTILLENNDATEENITQLEGKNAKSILHLATHGYAFPEFDYSDTTISKNSFRYSFRYSQNPMVRSGLILAGGNWAWTGSDTLTSLGAEQNGILTAEEVAQLNLKKTKLVVLSACETGLGKIDGSEGTFGLKRGFKLAGVEQMIVSLWSVPDKETMELMTLFYTDLTKTLNPIASFENAQREMRNKYPTQPEKWAGFVMVR